MDAWTRTGSLFGECDSTGRRSERGCIALHAAALRLAMRPLRGSGCAGSLLGALPAPE